MNQQVKIQIPTSFFLKKEPNLGKNPADLGVKLGGRQLPLEYFEEVVFPEEGGMLCKYKVFLFPTKGVPAGPALELLGVVKKLALTFVKICSAILSIVFRPYKIIFSPKKTLASLFYLTLSQFIEMCDQAFSLWYLEPKAMNTMCREVYYKTEVWINKNISEDVRAKWIRLLLIFCSIFQYDSAYRDFFQDLGMELNKDAFRKNPAKELERLLKIFDKRSRAGGPSIEKYLPIFRVLRVALFLSPKLKRTIIEIVDSLDFSGLSWQEMRNIFVNFDDMGGIIDFKEYPDLPLQGKEQRIGRDHADWYHCLSGSTYDFGGIPFHERLSFKRAITGKWAEKYQQKAQELQEKGAMVINK